MRRLRETQWPRKAWLVFSLRVRRSKDSCAAKTSLTCWPTWRVGWSGGGRFLKDQADATAANFPEVFRRKPREDSCPIEQDLAFLDFPVGRQKLQQREAASVLLPEPDSPSTPRISPGPRTKLTPTRAGRKSRPCGESRRREDSWTSRMGVMPWTRGRASPCHYPCSVKCVRRTRRTYSMAQER